MLPLLRTVGLVLFASASCLVLCHHVKPALLRHHHHHRWLPTRRGRVCLKGNGNRQLLPPHSMDTNLRHQLSPQASTHSLGHLPQAECPPWPPTPQVWGCPVFSTETLSQCSAPFNTTGWQKNRRQCQPYVFG